MGAAKEGCIDETLSALIAAAEAEFYRSQEGKFAALLFDKMSTIAMEEGRHSILAWRTVNWVGTEDGEDCEKVLEQMAED